MTGPENSNLDLTDLVRFGEAKILCGIHSRGVLQQYADELGYIKIGHTAFWSRRKCIAWRVGMPEILNTHEVAKILDVSPQNVRGSLDRWLAPDLIQWGHHSGVRSYQLGRVLRMRDIRDRVLATGRKTVPWSEYSELLDEKAAHYETVRNYKDQVSEYEVDDDANGFDTSDAYRDASQPSQVVPDSIGLGLAPTITDTVTRGQKPRQIVRPRSGKASRIGEAVRAVKEAAAAAVDKGRK